MTRESGPHILTSMPPSWELRLKTGEILKLVAHAYSEEADTEEGTSYVFVILLDGKPHYEMEVARIPAKLVTSVSGG